MEYLRSTALQLASDRPFPLGHLAFETAASLQGRSMIQMEIMKIDLREARSVNRTRESQRLQGRTCKVGEFRGIRRLFWPPGRTVSLPRQSGSRCIQGILRGLKIAHSQAKALARVSFVL
ncbi:MAG: hypothetical protein DMG05_17215 [Acidobacteria bacterium]|nr:MAG: hypothetical protein DMG05_17215 [Acidobacteriota bacterium]